MSLWNLKALIGKQSNKTAVTSRDVTSSLLQYQVNTKILKCVSTLFVYDAISTTAVEGIKSMAVQTEFNKLVAAQSLIFLIYSTVIWVAKPSSLKCLGNIWRFPVFRWGNFFCSFTFKTLYLESHFKCSIYSKI